MSDAHTKETLALVTKRREMTEDGLELIRKVVAELKSQGRLPEHAEPLIATIMAFGVVLEMTTGQFLTIPAADPSRVRIS